jgi:hypothetical protein
MVMLDDPNDFCKRIIGFEELGNDDTFTTATLELRLSMCSQFHVREGVHND